MEAGKRGYRGGICGRVFIAVLLAAWLLGAASGQAVEKLRTVTAVPAGPSECGALVAPRLSSANGPSVGWEEVFTDTFEGDFPGTDWDVSARGTSTATWDDTDYRSHGGDRSVYCAQSAVAAPGPYQPLMQSWMVYGPFDLSGAASARADFWFWMDSQNLRDRLIVAASRDGTTFTGKWYAGTWSWWQPSLDLEDFADETQVWVAIIFYSNATVNLEGVYVDDVTVWGYVAPKLVYVNDDSFAEPGSVCTAVGSDVNSGLSADAPKRTIQAAIDDYPYNTDYITIGVDPGTYVENVQIYGRQKLYIIGAGCTDVFYDLTADPSIVDGGAIGPCFTVVSSNAIEVYGLTLQNGRSQYGGGMLCYKSTAELVLSTVADNVAQYGGAYFAYLSSLWVAGNDIHGNQAATGAGGFVMRAGLETWCNTIHDNAAYTGGALYCATCYLKMINDTVVGNLAGTCGGLMTSGGIRWITNCILWDNGDDVRGTVPTYSCVQDPDVGPGNIHADPLFVDAGNGDYRIQAGSPCIDRANANLGGVPDEDMDVNERYHDDTGTPNAGAGTPDYMDMGAYEFQGTTPPAGEGTSRIVGPGAPVAAAAATPCGAVACGLAVSAATDEGEPVAGCAIGVGEDAGVTTGVEPVAVACTAGQLVTLTAPESVAAGADVLAFDHWEVDGAAAAAGEATLGVQVDGERKAVAVYASLP